MPDATPSDGELLAQAAALDPQVWQLYTLRRAPGCAAVPVAEAAEQIAAARLRARAALEMVSPGPAAHQLSALGVSVRRVAEDNPLGYPYFAIYDERSREVEVNGNLIFELARFLAKAPFPSEARVLAEWCARPVPELEAAIREVALWHEVYQVLDTGGKLPPHPEPPKGFFAKGRARRLQEGRAEVAAVEVSRVSSGLPFAPVVLEFAIAALAGDTDTIRSALTEIA